MIWKISEGKGGQKIALSEESVSYPSSKFSGTDDTALIHQGVRQGRKRNKFADPETNWEWRRSSTDIQFRSCQPIHSF